MSTELHPTTAKMGNRIRVWIDRLLGGTHNYYFIQLPTLTGHLTAWFLRRFYSGILFKSEQVNIIRNLPKDGLYVYTVKYPSRFEYLFYHTRHAQERIPVPELWLGSSVHLWQPLSRIIRIVIAQLDHLIKYRSLPDPYQGDFIKDQLIDGRAALLTLVEKRGFYRRFVKSQQDPLRFLIRLQKKTDRTIYLIPHLMFFGKRPIPHVPGLIDILFGIEQKPGRLRRLVTLFKHPGRVFVEISQPLDLKRFIEKPENVGRSPEYQALALRRHLLRQHNRHRQSITGPVVKSTEELKESILTNDRLRHFMAHYSQNRKEPLHKVRKEADDYLDEIAAHYSIFFIRMMYGIVGWIIHTMFDGAVVDTEGLNQVKAFSQRGPLVLIPCHKSHIDYLILSYVLFENNMPCPHIAAGKNLSFWPLGPLFRSGGAFFIRRTFRGAVLYAKVFSEYIHKLLEEGFNVEQFIEGGRSRTGKLLPPKLGLLSILINAYKNGACEDLIVVPVFIGYDQVLEESAYLHELEGGKKEPENLKQVVNARKFLKKRYGKIYINFSAPLSMNDLLRQFDMPLRDMPAKDFNALIRNLGWRTINAIDRVSVVTPYSLVAAAILNICKKRFSYEDIIDCVQMYLIHLTAQNARLADTLAIDHVHASENAIETYLQRKFIEEVWKEKKSSIKEALFIVSENRRPLLEYYKNNAIGYFVTAAITAAAILERDAFQFSSTDLQAMYVFLQDFFKYEFAFDVENNQEYHIRKSIKSFINEAILMPHRSLPDTYNVTSAGFRKLKIYAHFLRTYFESYWVVLNFIRKEKGDGTSDKEKIKKIQVMGGRMFKHGEIELKESLSKINYENALSLFNNHGIKNGRNEDKIARFDEVIQKFIALLVT